MVRLFGVLSILNFIVPACLDFFFFFNHVIYGEHPLPFWEFLMIVSDFDGREYLCDQPVLSGPKGVAR